MVSAHTMVYINTATSGTLCPHVLPVMDLQKMLSHIADALPPTLHLPVSPDDTLHFYRYLCTHILIENHGSRTFHYPVLSLQRSRQSILQHNHTLPVFGKPTILYSSSVCKSTAHIISKCSLQIWKTSGINLPTQIAPDV